VRRLHGVVTELTSTPSRSLASERGSLLIEVLVAAVLVAVIGVALFGSLNSAAKVSGKSKTRAGAAAVAQDDQERMRAMPVAALNNFRQHRDPVVMGKIAYVVDSRAEWIADAKGATDCTSNGAAADYLKITSTVTAKNIVLNPVVVTSTVTPAPGTFTSDEGSLAVSVVGADGTGRSNVQVSIDGPASDVQLTDANGCAFFGYEPVGDYDITATASGYVDPNGNASATGTSSIGSQTVATLSLKYDQAGQAKASFVTDPDDRPEIDSFQGSVGFANSGVTINSGVRYFADPSVPKAITTTPTLFPFPSAYSVFAGDCANNAAPTGVTPDALTVLPGKLDHTVTVHVPALNVRTQLNGVDKPNMYVRIKSTTAGCTPKTYAARASNSNARLDDPGFPYGTYVVCVDNRNQASIATARNVTSTITLNTPTSGPLVFNVKTTGALPLSPTPACS
jgi:Tfp pilus assembly protein PilV